MDIYLTMNEIIQNLKEINKNNEVFKEWESSIKNKNVSIVGHSSYLLGLNKGCEIDKNDIVVRINEAFSDMKEYKNDYGEKTDILYITNDHRMYQSGFLINNHQLIKNKLVSLFGVKSDHEDYDKFKKFMELLKENNKVVQNCDKRKCLIESLEGKLPHTGFFAILDILSFDPNSIYLPGFCFNLDKTRVLKRFMGYTDVVNIYHDAYLEIKIFKNIQKEYNIILDPYTEEKLQEFN